MDSSLTDKQKAASEELHFPQPDQMGFSRHSAGMHAGGTAASGVSVNSLWKMRRKVKKRDARSCPVCNIQHLPQKSAYNNRKMTIYNINYIHITKI